MGINILQTFDQLLIAALLTDGTDPITSGTATLRFYELQNDLADLQTYDFDDDTFKDGPTLTDDETTLTHRTRGDDSGVAQNTGLWTYRHTVFDDFVPGGLYIAHVNHSSAVPKDQMRIFQFGGEEGDPLSFTGEIQTGSDINTINTDLALATANYLNGMFIHFPRGTQNNQGLTRKITSYSVGDAATLDRALPQTPTTGGRFLIFGYAEG